MKKLNKMLRCFARDNRGSGIAMVLICMVCVTLMGATLMYMSYMGLRIKVTERNAAGDFYDAAAAMDEIRAGMQVVASDAVGAAYQAILLDYNNSYMAGDMTEKFQTGFATQLQNWKTGDTPLFLAAGKYDPTVLNTFVQNTAAQVVTTADEATWVTDPVNNCILLQNVHVTCTDPVTDYTTDVRSDIVISMPTFTYILSEYSISGLPEFAVIAQNSLEQNTGNSTIQIMGSAYAGKMELLSTGSMDISQGTMVCANTVHVTGAALEDNPRLVVQPNATLWANDILLEGGGKIALKGTAYVADDLDLATAGVSAQLSGKYFGFGNSTTNANQSSAILINGLGSQLDMSGLQRLMLAGHSFVSQSYGATGAGTDSGPIMGESIATRRDQQAYLLPVSYLTGVSANPNVTSEAATLPTVEFSATGQQKIAAPYGGVIKPVTVQIPGATGQRVTYYFVSFDSTEDANKFFLDYFNENTGEIQSYLNSYADLQTSLGIVETAGYTLQKGDDDTYTVRPVVHAGTLQASASQMAATFGQLKTTLFDRDAAGGASNPYQHFVKEDVLGALDDGVAWQFLNGDVVEGIVVDGNYTVDGATPETVRVILASGNVTVHKNFSGLIISGGTIDMGVMNVSLTADANGVTTALTARDSENRLLSDFLKDGVIENVAGGNGGSQSGWNFSDMVTYRNWTKN